MRFCRVPLLQDQACFQAHLTRVTKTSFKRACEALRKALTPICLRRTKALLRLPQPHLEQRTVCFSTSEREQYGELERYFRHALEIAASGNLANGKNPKAQNTMLEAILRLRIFCNHGTYTHTAQESRHAPFDADEELSLLQEKEKAYCECCLTEVSSGVLGACSHLMCATCYESACGDGQGDEGNRKCAVCDQSIKPEDLQNASATALGRKTSQLHTKKRSAKFEELMKDLQQFQGREKRQVYPAAQSRRTCS
jgi:SWI/SNF-related matrix-associated actin-dependent regulator of chromatin subfamily A3